MTNFNASLKFSSHCTLGESPLWHSASNSLFWLDIKQHKLYRHQNGQGLRQLSLTATLSYIAETSDPTQLIGLTESGIVLINVSTGELSAIQKFPDSEPEFNRSNDGGISPEGHLVFGTMDNQAQKHSGSIYYFDGTLRRLEDKIWVPNLFAFTGNNAFFFADSLNNSIQLCNINNNHLQQEHWVSTPEQFFPDGGCLDLQGGLWSAQWGSGKIVRYSLHDKTITDVIQLPEKQVTSCCFIGERMNQLFITTAAEGSLNAQAGNCYVCDLPYTGQPEHLFNMSLLRKEHE